MLTADIDKIKIGDKSSISQLMTEENTISFANISKDFNPIHLDKDYARNSMFKGQIVHGLMVASLFSGLFGTELPGIGCVYKSQNLKFKRPIYIGDEVEVHIEVTSINKDKKTVSFRTFCLINEKVMIEGDAEIYIP
jgi:3-hydroxybutyryl-CoA dehydratase